MEKILLGHGSGGRLMHDLIKEYFSPAFGMKELSDSAVVGLPDGKSTVTLAFTTDSYVVSPLFFPGGNIGDLAVNGTVNDLSVVGATPLYLTAGLIIEEGFAVHDMERIIGSMADAAKNAGVRIIAGDTKVVDKGKGDGIFINTSGIGIIPAGVDLGPQAVRAGDKILVSGLIGSHGIAVLAERNGLAFTPPVLSDSAPLNGLVTLMTGLTGDIRMMRDPTRGGVATTLKEIAVESGCAITVFEDMLPVSGGVRGACDLLGLDPLYIANEGILVAVVSPGAAGPLADKMREHPLGRRTAVIGEVAAAGANDAGRVLLRTALGGTRVVDMLSGEQLPRIC